MAERRMFAKTIIDSDAFLDMPLSTQALYFHLSMRADDDGFINNPKKIAKMLGSSDDELKVLMAKKFILVFESGVIVIKHWRIHNYIQKDRYKETVYTEEKAMLAHKENNGYTMYTPCIQNGYTGKDRLEIEIELELDTRDKTKDANAPFSFSLSKDTHYDNLSAEYKANLKSEIESLKLGLSHDDFVAALQSKSSYKYKNFVLAYKNWAKKDFNQGKQQSGADRNRLNQKDYKEGDLSDEF